MIQLNVQGVSKKLKDRLYMKDALACVGDRFRMHYLRVQGLTDRKMRVVFAGAAIALLSAGSAFALGLQSESGVTEPFNVEYYTIAMISYTTGRLTEINNECQKASEIPQRPGVADALEQLHEHWGEAVVSEKSARAMYVLLGERLAKAGERWPSTKNCKRLLAAMEQEYQPYLDSYTNCTQKQLQMVAEVGNPIVDLINGGADQGLSDEDIVKLKKLVCTLSGSIAKANFYDCSGVES